MRNCASCKWCEMLTNSKGNTLYVCLEVYSGAYLEQTDLCGSCDLDAEDEEETLI